MPLTSALRQTITFGAVGVAATVTYFAAASAGSGQGMSAPASSLLAYLVSSIVSYCGHRWLTFGSRRTVRQTGARFLALTLAQYGLAVAIPLALTERIGFAPGVSYAAVCVVIPIVSFLVMSRFVFRAADLAAPAALKASDV